ncbi:Triosephosphate isomerase [Candidatus Ichthyocystis hellenicum]|uniref:Triosephosphate isomerase n=1 Tax=Candidatus Ichthyocystis hellenicum TaxID=1561003 RepID=A0A0S4M4A6_9BURK|nr:triose-phosphate isomerase [Candidatus Ichthyocystis hellenicum]CUT17839.1 Triosephosphate isomerase [Candidatus Ichthyocystis hellenicum]
MRKKYVVANWKMNGHQMFVRDWISSWNKILPSLSRVRAVLCPPYVHIKSLMENLNGNVSLGAQTVSSYDQGSFTGDISASMLTDLGCEYVIIGHSERRSYAREVADDFSLKINQSLMSDLTPFVCIGENAEQYQKNLTKSVLFSQIMDVFTNVDIYSLNRIVIAYEPIWAIGTGHIADPYEVTILFSDIRKFLLQTFGPYMESVSLIYGGSVSPRNVPEFLEHGVMEIDGFLVGSSSLEPADFVRICEIGEVAWTSS